VQGTPVKIYVCPSRRPAAQYFWSHVSVTDYVAIAPGTVPMHKNSANLFDEDTTGLVWGWSATGASGNNPGPEGSDYGQNHGVLSMGNRWQGEVTRHTFASVKDGTSNTMMVAEKFCFVDQYITGNGADDTGPIEGLDGDTTRTSATCQTNRAGAIPLSNPHQDVSINSVPQLNGDEWTTVMQLGSAHPAGINAVFADGSVHNIKYGIDPDVFNALGNMDDGTTLHSDPDNIQ
jgi:prepilin-type processing-associated H-X9-DG protein